MILLIIDVFNSMLPILWTAVIIYQTARLFFCLIKKKKQCILMENRKLFISLSTYNAPGCIIIVFINPNRNPISSDNKIKTKGPAKKWLMDMK